MNENCDPRLVKRLKSFALLGSCFVIAIGIMGLLGWIFDIRQLKTILPGLIAIKANTTIGLILLGAALLLSRSRSEVATAKRYVAKACGMCVAVLGAASFVEYVFHWDCGIDQLLFREPGSAAAVAGRPGLMSPVTGLDFLLLGLAIVLLDWRTRRIWLSQALALLATAATTLGLLDYLLGHKGSHVQIALQTAVSLFVFSVTVVFSRSEWGLGRLLCSHSMGGILARRFLPLSIGIPVVIGWFRWYAEMEGLYSDWGGIAIMILSMIILLAGVSGWTAYVIDRTEGERELAAQESRRASLYARSLIEASVDPLVTISKDGKIMDVNQATEHATGLTRSQLVGSDFSNYFTQPEQARAGYEQVFSAGSVRDYPLSLRHTSGAVMDVLYNATVFRNETGEVQGVFAAARNVTARRRAEEGLRKASLYARNLIEASLDPLVTISKEGKIMDVNRATEVATGLPRAHLIGSDFSIYFTEPEKAQAGYEQVFATGAVRDYPLTLRHTSGQAMDVLYNTTVYQSEAGEVEGVFAAARNITERKQAELALQFSERRYRSLAVATSQVIWTTNEQGEVVGDMPMWRDFTGQTLEEIQGWGWIKCVHADDRERTAEVWKRAVKNRTLYDTEYRLRRRDGEYRYALVRGVPVLEPDGRIREWIGTCTDITERRKAEEQLRLSQERLALAQAAGRSGSFDWDIQNNINVWSPEVEELYGLPRGGFGGTLESWERLVYPDDLPQARSAIEESLKTGEFAGEWRVRRPDTGEIRWLDARAKVFFDKGGRPSRMVGINMDITERKNAEEEIRQLNDELEQRVQQRTAQLEASNKELEAFTYSVSHDLRAPLRHVAGFSKMLCEEYESKLEEGAKHYLRRITEGVQRMGQLVDDLLNLARVGRKELGLQVTGLSSIVQEVLAESKPEMEGRQVEIKMDTLPFVECDPALMKQVFQNLLANALKFTRPRSPAVIEVGHKEEDGRNIIFVRDNGVGFSMKYVDKLFGVFQRLHRPEDFEGTGVGLATVQRIINKHGGRIWAEAELEKGATFYFTLAATETKLEKTIVAVAGAQ